MDAVDLQFKPTRRLFRSVWRVQSSGLRLGFGGRGLELVLKEFGWDSEKPMHSPLAQLFVRAPC